MIRLTVLYNLPPGSDEDEFLRWRLGEHQASNAGMPGVQRTDFAQIQEALPVPGAADTAPWRYMTTADWATREDFERGFYDPEIQAGLRANVKRIADALFLLSEVLASSEDRD